MRPFVEDLDGVSIDSAQFINAVHRFPTQLHDLVYETEHKGDSEIARLYLSGASCSSLRDAGDMNACLEVTFVLRSTSLTRHKETWAGKSKLLTRDIAQFHRSSH